MYSFLFSAPQKRLCPLPHGRIGKAFPFQAFHFGIVLFVRILFLLPFTLCPAAVTFRRVPVTPE
jgi:hypothetical protein